MNNNRRRFLQLLGASALAPTVSSAADTYPTRPIRIIVGFAPGTATDIAMRLIAQPLSVRLPPRATSPWSASPAPTRLT